MATLVVSPQPSPSPLMSPAAAAYASKARCDSPSPSSKSKTSRIFRRVVSRTPFSSTNNTPSLTSSPFSPTYSLVSTPVETEVEVLAPCIAPTEREQAKKVVNRRLSRKPVPSSPELEAEEAAFQAATEQQPRTKRARPSPQPAEVVDGLWTSTCDARPDDFDFPSSSSPFLYSRRSSSASSASSSTSYDAPLPPAVADLAILLSTSARRASIPSPAALAGNAALSPRLARIAAFTNTVTQLDGGVVQGAGGGEVEKAAKEHAKRLRNSFDLPEIELPWLPTLFPEGTPFASTSTSSAFPAPPARSTPPPSSPAMSNASSTLLYPLALASSGSSSASSSSSSCGSSHLSSSSTLLTPPASLLAPSPSSPKTSNRKSMFRITTASGAQLVLDLPYTSPSPSLAPSPSLSSSPSPRLPSLDFSPFLPHRRTSSDWSCPPSRDWDVEEKSLGVQGVHGGVSTSWVERDEEDVDGEGEVLVIAMTPKLG